MLTSETESEVSREYPVNLQKRRYNPEVNGSQSSLVAIFHSGGWCVYTAHTVLRLQKCCVLARPLSIPHSTTGKTQSVLTNHELSKTHQSPMVAAENFLIMSRREESINELFSHAYSAY